MNAWICELPERAGDKLLTINSHIQAKLLHNRNVNELMNMLTQPTNKKGNQTMTTNKEDIIDLVKFIQFQTFRGWKDYIQQVSQFGYSRRTILVGWNYNLTNRIIF